MEIIEGVELISTAILQDSEEKLMFRWIVGGYEQEISFAEFKNKLNCDIENGQLLDTRTEIEILEDVRNILG